jgi:hypothetical protein
LGDRDVIAHRIDIDIATEFTPTPGPRKRSEGDHSGEQFLAELLRPRFVSALEAGSTLHISLDGAIGYPTSFLEEAFGGLAREFGAEKVERTLDIACKDEPYLADQIHKFIRNAKLA